jgi:hypothetical protein
MPDLDPNFFNGIAWIPVRQKESSVLFQVIREDLTISGLQMLEHGKWRDIGEAEVVALWNLEAAMRHRLKDLFFQFGINSKLVDILGEQMDGLGELQAGCGVNVHGELPGC